MSLIERVAELLSVSGQFHIALADLDLQVSARLDADGSLPVGDGKVQFLGCRYRGHFQFQGFGGDKQAPAGG